MGQAKVRTSPRRLVVDATPLSSAWSQTGVARWTSGVLQGLEAVSSDWEVHRVLLGRSVLPRVPVRLQRVLMMVGAFPPIERWVPNADVMLGSAFIPWPTDRALRVPVIHDLCFVKHPDLVSLRNRVFLGTQMKRSVREARLVVTVSEAIRDEIVEHYGIDRDRVTVVPNGLDPDVFHPSVSRPPIGLVPSRYLLFVGTLEPRKNLAGALRAHSVLRRASKDVPPLVVVGKKGWRRSSWEPPLRSAIARGDAFYLGSVDDSILASLYAGAEMLVFPTLYEGFGLPVLEAIACGCPVVASDLGVLREVAGDAALYVRRDTDSLAAGIAEVLNDEASRVRMIERGVERAKGFSWEESATRLRTALEVAIAR